MKFLSPEVALYLCKFTLRPCIECCCHAWTGALSCYLELLNKLQKQIFRTLGSSLTAFLEPLVHRRNIASLSLFCRYSFGRYSSELAQMAHFPYSRGRSTRYSDTCMIFLSPFLDITRLSMVTVSSHSQTLELSAYRLLSFDL